MTLKVLDQRNLKDGIGIVSCTEGGLPVFSANTVFFDKHEGIWKRKIGLSLCSGCLVGCIYCFTRRYQFFKPLSVSEIREQVEKTLQLDVPNSGKVAINKFSFKQMGDPLVNQANTLEVIKELYSSFPDFEFVVSTSGITNDGNFFSELSQIAQRGAKIRLQFSCHTTSDEERVALSPNQSMMNFAQIAAVIKSWQQGKVTLNFVQFAGYEFDAGKIATLFSPTDIFVKVNYIDENLQTRSNGLSDANAVDVRFFERRLSEFGFDSARRNK